MIRMRVCFSLIAVVAATALVIGCEAPVDPILETTRPFTIYGYFNPRADTQAVRVIEIREQLERLTPRSIDAVVSSKDLQTGKTRVWKDSLIQLDNGQVRHVFWSDFRAKYEHTYRLTVESSDGATSSATVTVPPNVNLEVVESIRSAVIRGDVPAVINARLVYHTSTIPPVPPPPVTEQPVFNKVVVDYTDELLRTDNGWRFEFDITEDYEAVINDYKLEMGVVHDYISLDKISIQMMVANKAWRPPGGTFDPDILMQPGTMSNVKNGFGFVGAGYLTSESHIPPIAVIEGAGFATCRPPLC